MVCDPVAFGTVLFCLKKKNRNDFLSNSIKEYEQEFCLHFLNLIFSFIIIVNIRYYKPIRKT